MKVMAVVFEMVVEMAKRTRKDGQGQMRSLTPYRTLKFCHRGIVDVHPRALQEELLVVVGRQRWYLLPRGSFSQC